MANNNLSHKLFPFCLLMFLSYLPSFIYAQSVGIGTSSPNTFSMLDITSSNKGLLLPRVALANTTSNSPIGAFVAGMQVYNTATAGDVTPGFYGCDGTKWVRLANAVADWSLTGNAGTNPTINFIGTTDDQDIIFKRNNVRAGFINNVSNNTSFGVGSLNISNTGTSNSAYGKHSMASNTTGIQTPLLAIALCLAAWKLPTS
ncbi:MAG: hypothetical protein IPN49_18695 [Saprospiraceae bacterium]|nr:hypothetical protein [Saprospiraceae bacterium]